MLKILYIIYNEMTLVFIMIYMVTMVFKIGNARVGNGFFKCYQQLRRAEGATLESYK